MADEPSIYERVADLEAQMLEVYPMTIAADTNLNNLVAGAYYVPTAAVSATLTNKPIASTATAFIKVIEGGSDGQLTMYYIPCTKDTPSYYHRAFYAGSWGSWNEVNLFDSGWINLPLSNGATAFDSAQTPQYRKIGHVVYLRGVYKNVTANETVIATLPAAYRPSQRIIVACVRAGNVFDRIEIETDGTINYMATTATTTTNNTWHSLANVSFAI